MRSQLIAAFFAAIVTTVVALPTANPEAQPQGTSPFECTQEGAPCIILVSTLSPLSYGTNYKIRESMSGY